MRHLTLVLVFLLGLFLKVSLANADEVASDADFESVGDVAHYQPVQPVQPIAPPPPVVIAPAPAASATAVSSEWNQVNPTYQTVAPSQAIQNNNNINLGPNAHNANVMANGPVASSSIAYGSAEADAATVLGTKHRHSDAYSRVSIMPMVGGSFYSGRWNDHIGNAYTFGLIVEAPLNPYLSFEAEGEYAQYNISYSYNPAYLYNHDFQQYQIGGNLKGYLTRGTFRPYLGGGLAGIYFNNMTHGPYFPAPYSTWVGFGQLMGGADIVVSEDISIGGRAAWLIPMFNRPGTVDNGVYSAPYYEEAGAINTTFYRLMATLKVAL